MHPSRFIRHRMRPGFSLIITLVMMILLATLALGLLSLSAISLRNGSHETARMTARANARCALMLALGQLQRQMGPDQRISAPAGLAGSVPPASHEHWTGVWRSATAAATTFPSGRKPDFAEWLVSSPDAAALEAAASDILPSAIMERAEDGRQTRVPVLKAPGGDIAWWTSDEAQKATLDLSAPQATTDEAHLLSRNAPPWFSPETIESIGTFPHEPDVAGKLVSARQAELVVPKRPDSITRFATSGARSLLTDVRRGGFKRDFSTLLEMPEDKITGYGTWKGANALGDREAYLYGDAGVAIGARWNHLYAYYNLYKDVSFVAGEPQVRLPTKPLIDWRLADAKQDFGDEKGGFRYPRISRILYVFSYSAEPPATTGGLHTLRLGVDVYVVLWNPFDVKIVWPANSTFLCKFSRALPFRFKWHLNGVQQGGDTRLDDIIAAGTPGVDGLFLKSQFLQSPTGGDFTMSPGETRLFSLGPNRSNFQSTAYHQFIPGLYYNDLLFYNRVLGSAAVQGNAGDLISVGMEPFNEGSAYATTAQYVDFWIYDRARGWPYYEHRGEIIAQAGTQFVQQLKPLSKDVLPSVTMAEAAAKKRPFAAFVMEMKSASDSTQATPSFLHSGIARLSTRVGANNEDFALDRLEYKLEKMDSFQSDLIQCSLPGDPNGENHGYIGSGRMPMNGRTHMVASAIPAVPPISLAAFRHASAGDGAATLRATLWSMVSTPTPAYADQAIGNSYAHPRLPAASVTSGNLYDHSYRANEALWDGWFFSSLASRDATGATVPLKSTWMDFLAGKKPLLNPRITPWKGLKKDDDLASEVFNGTDLKIEAHRAIAASLLLAGGFNVNSTSVDAWTAFLSSTRGKSIRKLNRTGNAGGSLVKAEGTLFSRSGFVLDDAVDSGGSEDSQYAGFRDVSDAGIRELAAKVVEQVKKRGPFLSVSEFVNRRPGSDSELALCGALQAAINATDLNDDLKALGKDGTATPTGGSFANSAAARLNTSAGAPGWLMQGDVLEPLGPFITVRGDTFRIRAYGSATGRSGEITARAWCEAVVQRTPEFMEKTDKAETYPPVAPLNLTFGREFRIVSFRWLAGPDD